MKANGCDREEWLTSLRHPRWGWWHYIRTGRVQLCFLAIIHLLAASSEKKNLSDQERRAKVGARL